MRERPLSPEDLRDLARLMRRVDLFSPLSVAELDELLLFVRLAAYAPGEAVFQEGSPGDAFYLLRSGRASVRVKAGWLGLRRGVGNLGPGQFFGETALLEAGPRTAEVRCEEAAEIFVLGAEDFRRALAANPEAEAKIRRVSESRRRDTARRSE